MGVNDITKFGFDVMDCCNMNDRHPEYTIAIIGGKLGSAPNAPDLGIIINVSEHLLTVATPSMSIRSQVWPKTYEAYMHVGAVYYSRKIQNRMHLQTLLSRYCDWRSMLAIKEINSLQDQLCCGCEQARAVWCCCRHFARVGLEYGEHLVTHQRCQLITI